MTTVVAFDAFDELLAPLTVRKAAATALATLAPFCLVVVFGSAALAASASSFLSCLAEGFRVTVVVAVVAAARVDFDLNLSLTRLASDDVAANAAAFAGEAVVGFVGDTTGLRGDWGREGIADGFWMSLSGEMGRVRELEDLGERTVVVVGLGFGFVRFFGVVIASCECGEVTKLFS